jgi:hypothetical protein
MSGHLPVEQDELRIWALAEVTVRATVGASEPGRERSKLWLVGWTTAALAVTLVLAFPLLPRSPTAPRCSLCFSALAIGPA